MSKPKKKIITKNYILTSYFQNHHIFFKHLATIEYQILYVNFDTSMTPSQTYLEFFHSDIVKRYEHPKATHHSVYITITQRNVRRPFPSSSRAIRIKR